MGDVKASVCFTPEEQYQGLQREFDRLKEVQQIEHRQLIEATARIAELEAKLARVEALFGTWEAKLPVGVVTVAHLRKALDGDK